MIVKKKEEAKTAVPTPAKAVLDNGPQIGELAKQVSDLKDTVNILISQIQGLRSEIKQKK